MKKLISIALTVCLLLSLASCATMVKLDDEGIKPDKPEKETSTQSSIQDESEKITDPKDENSETENFTTITETESADTETEPAPMTYTVTFAVNGEKYAEVTYTEGAESIEAPEAPAIEGMIVHWEDFTLSNENITVNAIIYSDGLTYTPFTLQDKSGKVIEMYKITGYTGTLTDIIIPSKHDGLPIFGINSRAFADSSITSVIILDGTASIGEYAFYNCQSLKSVTLPNTLGGAVGTGAFMDCTSLTDVKLGSSLTLISENMFYGCTSLTEISLPDSVQTVDNQAFAFCTSLEKVISRGVDLLSGSAFTGCDKFTSSLHIHEYGEGTVVLEPTCGDTGVLSKACTSEECENFVRELEIAPTGEHSFGEAFERSALTCTTDGETVKVCEICGYENVTEISHVGHLFGDWTVTKAATCATDGTRTRACKYCDQTEEYTVKASGNHSFVNGVCTVCSEPESITANLEFYLINNDAEYSVSFDGTEADIDAVILPAYHDGKAVTKINYIYAPSASTLYIPSTISEIGREAFYGMKKLTTVYYNAVNCKNIDSSKGCFIGAGSEGDGITLYVGKGVQSIPSYLFTARSSGYVRDSFLERVIFEEESSCTSIGAYAFYECKNLSEINLPESLENVGSYAFSGNRAITELTIPKSLKKASGYPFAGMYALKTIYYNAINFNATSTPDSSFSSYGEFGLFAGSGCEDGITVYIGADVEQIPPTLFSAYNTSSLPKVKNVIFDRDSKCASIGGHAFRSLSLETIVLPVSLKTVYSGAFNMYDPYGYAVKSNVFYYGSESEWNSIDRGSDNNMLGGTGSTVYFYSETEAEGSFWHMVCGVPVIFGYTAPQPK